MWLSCVYIEQSIQYTFIRVIFSICTYTCYTQLCLLLWSLAEESVPPTIPQEPGTYDYIHVVTYTNATPATHPPTHPTHSTHTHTHQEIDHYRCEAESSAKQSREETLNVMADHTHQLLLGTAWRPTSAHCTRVHISTLCGDVSPCISLSPSLRPGLEAKWICVCVLCAEYQHTWMYN